MDLNKLGLIWLFISHHEKYNADSLQHCNTSISYANVPLTSDLAGLWSFTSDIIWPQSSWNHTGNEHEKNRKYFKQSSKNASKFTVRQIFSRKGSLNNYLNIDYILYTFLNDRSCDIWLTWSVHQYHTDPTTIPKMTPGQGKSPSSAGLIIWLQVSGG